MLKVTIINDTKFLNPKYRDRLLKEPLTCEYLIFGEISRQNTEFLQKEGAEIVKRKDYSKDQKEAFLKEYIDLIGALSLEQNTFLWWATDVSSKNRFRSNLSMILQQFTEIVNVIELDDCEHLVVVNPLIDLLPALEKFLEKRKIAYSYCGDLLKRRLGRTVFKIRKMLAIIYDAGKFYARALYARWHLGKLFDKGHLPDRRCYVIKTFVYNHSFGQDGAYKDAFFGSLPYYLSKKKNVVIFANILGNYRYCIGKIKEKNDLPIIPVEMFISFGDVLKGIRLALFGTMRLKKGVSFFQRDVTEILREKLEHPMSGIQAGQLLHYGGTKGLLRRISPEYFLMSYENNPWEKMCVFALREDSPRTKIIGYQPNVIPQASANMFVSQKEKAIMPIPDLVLTSGEIPKRIMESYGSLNGGFVSPSCALRHEYLFRMPNRPYQRKGTLLLALEGIIDVHELINYVINELRTHPEYRIVIRAHPHLPFRRIQHKIYTDIRNLTHFTLSDGKPLEEEIEDSDIVIYWGSTVAMEALWMGKPVIHYDNGSILSFDPLFDCPHLKWTVCREDVLIDTIRKVESLSTEEYVGQKARARDYLEKYYFQVKDDRLMQFVH